MKEFKIYRVNTLPQTGRNGDQYLLRKPNGRYEAYVVQPDGTLAFNKGITDDQNTRLERMSSEQISKVENITTGDITKLKEDYTKAEIDQQFNDVRNFANSSRINLNGATVLPVPPRRPDNTIIEDAWVRLAQNVTYTQAGGSPLTGIDGHETVAEWNNEDGEWVLVDMGELPSTPPTPLADDFGNSTGDGATQRLVTKVNNDLQPVKAGFESIVEPAANLFLGVPIVTDSRYNPNTGSIDTFPPTVSAEGWKRVQRIPVTPNTQYYVKNIQVRIVGAFYSNIAGGQANFISSISETLPNEPGSYYTEYIFTTPPNCYAVGINIQSENAGSDVLNAVLTSGVSKISTDAVSAKIVQDPDFSLIKASDIVPGYVTGSGAIDTGSATPVSEWRRTKRIYGGIVGSIYTLDAIDFVPEANKNLNFYDADGNFMSNQKVDQPLPYSFTWISGADHMIMTVKGPQNPLIPSNIKLTSPDTSYVSSLFGLPIGKSDAESEVDVIITDDTLVTSSRISIGQLANPFLSVSNEADLLFKRSGILTNIPDDVMPLIIIGGQSNADGRAPLSSMPSGVLDENNSIADYMMWNASSKTFQSYQLGVNTGAESNTATTFAFDPFFAKAYLDSNPGKKIYAIRQTIGGVPISEKGEGGSGNRFMRWQPKTELIASNESSMCLALIAKVKEAMEYAKNSNLKLMPIAVLWHQGEGDANELRIGDFPVNLSNLISWFRGLFLTPSLPFLNGEILEINTPVANRGIINETFADLNNLDSNMLTVDMSAHQTNVGDGLHFDSQAQQYLGEQMFANYEKLKGVYP